VRIALLKLIESFGPDAGCPRKRRISARPSASSHRPFSCLAIWPPRESLNKFNSIHNKIDDICPVLGYLEFVEAHGNVPAHPEVRPRDRDRAFVSSLTAMDLSRELGSHVGGGRDIAQILEDIPNCGNRIGPESPSKPVDNWSHIAAGPRIDVREEYPGQSV